MTRELAVGKAAALAGAVVRSLLLLGCAACSPASESVTLPEPDGERFALEVYPVLLRDCAMSECHGAKERFFRVFGPGRTRLSSSTDPLEAVMGREVLESYQRARAMLDDSKHVERSLLLLKPLARAAGGATHGGTDRYGRNVYASKDDPGYVVIDRWARAVPLDEESP